MTRYSHSRITSFEQCPRKFLWRYLWNVSPPVEGVEAFLGKRVHEALEGLYAVVMRGQPPPTLEEVVGGYEASWERHWGAHVRIVADLPAATYRELGRTCLEGYYRRHEPFTGGTTVGVERGFEFPLGDGSPIRLRGFLDRLDIAADGAAEVHDYKTGRRKPSRQELVADLQIGIYEMAARRIFPEHRRVRLVWHYLRSGAEIRIPARDPEDLARLQRDTRARVERIEAGIEAYRSCLDPTAATALEASRRARPASVPEAARVDGKGFPAVAGPLCRWCSFLDWCPEGSAEAGAKFSPPPPDPPCPDRCEQGRLF